MRLWKGLSSVTELSLMSHVPAALTEQAASGRKAQALEAGPPGGVLLVVTLDKFPNLL